MQETWVQSLVQENPTCCEPVHHNYWACALENGNHNCWAHVPQLMKPSHPIAHALNKRRHHNEKLTCGNQRKALATTETRPSPAKNKEIDTTIKTLEKIFCYLLCSGPFLFFQPSFSLMMTFVRHLLLDLSSHIKLNIINTQCSTQNNPFIHLPHFALITSFPGPQCLKNKLK